MNATDAYQVMFTEYPDVVSVDQMCQMLGGIGCKTAYQLLREQKIKSFMVGRRYCIPKIHISQLSSLWKTAKLHDFLAF